MRPTPVTSRPCARASGGPKGPGVTVVALVPRPRGRGKLLKLLRPGST